MKETAIITGATSGIGYELARIFASNGINLVLVARGEERLNEIARELSANKVEVRVFARDLSKLENAISVYNELKVQHIGIDYLVNNAGFGINGEYINIEWEKEAAMLGLNMITLAYFTKVFARDMVARGHGRILNVGSTGSFVPGPFMAGYCASKAFVLNLSEAVNHELKGTDVHVTTLCPGVTDTKFHDVAQTGKTFMVKGLSHATADEVARYGYKIMMKGRSMGIHGWANKFMIFSNRLLARKWAVNVSGMILKKK